MVSGICRFCGEAGEGALFSAWVKPTFTDYDKLLPGEIVCANCLPWFDEGNVELQTCFGKDKPQRMRNYSHFVVNGTWYPLSKADKTTMTTLLLTPPFPELAVIAVSGQKHIVFRAQANPPGGTAGWVQFEDQKLWLRPDDLRWLLERCGALYAAFSKAEIESGDYLPQRILQFGLAEWRDLETQIKPLRGSLLFQLALFLLQRSEDGDGNTEAAGSDAAAGDLARDTGRLQEPVSDEHLGAVSGPGSERGLHEQSGEIRQLPLF